jgi:hypothetical protein
MSTGFLTLFHLSLQRFLVRTSVGRRRIIPFLVLSSNWQFPAWHKPPPLSQHSIARDWNRERISNLANVACLIDSCQTPSQELIAPDCIPAGSWHFVNNDSADLPCYKNLRSKLLKEPCQMARVMKSVSKNVILWLALIPKCMEEQWVWHAWVGADYLSPLFYSQYVLEGFCGFCSWRRVRTESAWWDAWGTHAWLLQKRDRYSVSGTTFARRHPRKKLGRLSEYHHK